MARQVAASGVSDSPARDRWVVVRGRSFWPGARCGDYSSDVDGQVWDMGEIEQLSDGVVGDSSAETGLVRVDRGHTVRVRGDAADRM
jgi:hypothetical protein